MITALARTFPIALIHGTSNLTVPSAGLYVSSVGSSVRLIGSTVFENQVADYGGTDVRCMEFVRVFIMSLRCGNRV